MSFRSGGDSFRTVGEDFDDPGAGCRRSKSVLTTTDDDLALGSMSPIFGAVTLCCCQVGACLVAYASYLKAASPYIGIAGLVSFGCLQINSVSYLQEVWILTRKRQLEQGVHHPIQYRSLVEHALRGHTTTESLVLASRATQWLQIVSLMGTAVGEVIQTSSSLYAATRFENQRFWAIVAGLGLMTPLVLLPGYEALEKLSLGAVVAVIFTGIVVSLEAGAVPATEEVSFAIPNVVQLFTGLSGVTFAWSGLAIVPELQSCLAQPSQLGWCARINVLYTLALVLPTACLGYRAFGENVTSNVLDQLGDSWAVTASCYLLAAHMVIAFAVLLIPVVQSLEHTAGLPADEYGWGKVGVRLCTATFTVFLAIAFPFFNQICGIVGSIAAAFLSFWGPPLLWLLATSDAKSDLLDDSAEAWRGFHRGVAWAQMAAMFAVGTCIGLYASLSSFIASVDHLGIFAKNGVL